MTRLGPATLRILFTLAILAGLAVAPNAQTFRWEPGRHNDVGARVDRALERARAQINRTWAQIERSMERSISRRAQLDRQKADRIARQVRAQVQRDIKAQVRVQQRVTRSINRGTYNVPSSWSRTITAQTGTDADPCSNRNSYNDDYFQHCEVRDSTMPAGPLTVDGGNNGGIHVEGWDRNDIRVRAIVRTNARSDGDARQLATGVRVTTGGGRVSADGPDSGRREWWSVSYRINVPRKNDLDLNASNGGITINGVTGNLKFDTTNGGVTLNNLGGHVVGSTTNGGLTVNLSGDRWDGDGIDVQTRNGGVTLAIPEGYNAQLEARTNNGGLRVDFPVTVQGNLTGRNGGLTTTLGSGGPTVRVGTNNGGLRINRR
jgi:hypothetical protein